MSVSESQHAGPDGAGGAARLFSPIAIRGIRAKNRIMLSPMAQYSAHDGFVTDWHFAHLAKMAMGGAGIVFMETTKVEQRGLGSVGDAGIWKDDQIPPLRRITDFLRAQGVVAGIQLAHAGRKAGNLKPWEGFGPLDRTQPLAGTEHWEVIAPSAIAPFEGWPTPRAMTHADIQEVVTAWGEAARRAHQAGFDVIEIHGAHGYLIHQFLSPAANHRTDAYGGNFENRTRFAVEVVDSIRAHWPSEKPLFFRISAVDEAGWELSDSVRLARILKTRGVDAMDCSSGGIALRSPTASAISRRLGFQVPYAAGIRKEAGIATIAVGLIVEARQAEQVLRNEQADIVALGRELLYNPNWPLHAAQELNADPEFKYWPEQYGWWLDRRAKAGITS